MSERQTRHLPIFYCVAIRSIVSLYGLVLLAINVSGTETVRALPPSIRHSRALQPRTAAIEAAFAAANRLRSEWKEQSLRAAIVEYSESRSLAIVDRNPRSEALALKGIGEVYFILGRNQDARRAYTGALGISRRTRDRQLEADLLNGLGEAELDEESSSAFRRFDRALAISEAQGYAFGKARALAGLGVTESMRNKPTKALDFLNQSLSLFSSIGDAVGEADALTNIGYVISDLGERRKALDYFARAVQKAAQGDDLRREAQAEAAMGLMQTALGDMDSARESHKKAVEGLTAIGDRISLGIALNSLGYLNQELGDSQYALSCYTRSLDIAKKSRQPRRQANALGLLGRLYEANGEAIAALRHYKQRLRISVAVGDPRQQAYALTDMGSVYGSIGRIGVAVSCYRRSIRISRFMNHPRLLAFATNNLGRVYHRMHDYAQAGRLYQKALDLIIAAGDQRGVTFVINNIARLKRDQGDLDGALAEARRLIAMIESQRISIASSDLRASYFAAAYPHYELYVDLLMRKHEEQPDAGFDAVAFEQSEKGRARSLTEMLSEGGANVREGVDPQLIKTERDLHLLLDAKANQQMSLLNGRYAAKKGAALARTRKERAGAAKSISQLEVELAALDQEVDDTRRQLQGVEADIKRVSPKYSALKAPNGLSLEAVQRQVLDSDTLALEYSLGDERSYLWLIGNDFFRTFILPGRAQIERTAARLLKELSRDPREPGTEKRTDPRSKSDRARSQSSGPARFLGLARQLSKLVLPSAIAELGIANKRLVIVPDGALQFVPFAVLLNPAREDFLFEQHEIISLPSLSALAELRTDMAQRARAPGLLALFADPVFEADDPRITRGTERTGATPVRKTRSRGSEIAARHGLQPELSRPGAMRGFFDLLSIGGDASFHRLLYAHYEADSIEAIAAGEDVKSMRGVDANKSVATTMDLSGYRIVHFATHSLLDFRHPELSCIVLSQRDANGVERDGFLRLNDIYNMKLAADLVVLSACQTAIGREVRGEGLVSLTRGFMYAGAARVVASLWKIDDEASKELMARFYDHMLGDDHMSAAAALREAQLEIMKEERWNHPYFWAAFVLQGEWR